MSKKQRIVHIIDSLATGGAEILLKNTVNILPDYDHTVVYLREPSQLRKEFDFEVEFICLGHDSWKKSFKTVKSFRRIVKERKPLLVHAHLQRSTLIARLSNIKPPLVSTLHSTYSVDAFAKNSLALRIERATVGRQKAIIGISRFVLEDYLSCVAFKGRTFVLYNFLEDSYFQKSACEKAAGDLIKIVAVGNLKEAKNYLYLLEVIKHLPRGNFSLDIYGDGMLKAELENITVTDQLPVFFRGTSNDLKTILPKYDLFVQVSRHEGFGLSVAEAMALKVPVAISEIAVFKEISAGKAHFLPLNNAKKAASIIADLIGDAELRNLYVEDGFRQIKSISSSRTYQLGLLAIYNSVLN
jgi:glycosyltransferase involved in cell wall biosynthesis